MATDPSGDVVFLVHGVRENGDSWYGAFKDQMQKFWKANGYENQDVIGITYGGPIRKDKTDIFLAATPNLAEPSIAVRNGAKALNKAIQDYKLKNPNEPISIIAHSNGVAVTLFALKGTNTKVNNLILLNSPLTVSDKGNQQALAGILNNNVKPGGHVYNVFSRDDGVAGIDLVGGARRWSAQSVAGNNKFTNVDQTTSVGIYVTGLNLNTNFEKGIAAHNSLAEPKMPFARRTHEPGKPFDKNSNDVLLPNDVAPATSIQLNLISEYYAVLTGWKK
jgi:hypothetical protein